MTIEQTIYVLFWITVTVLPLIFRRNRTLRIVCVFVLLFNSLALLHFGLRLAARNVPLPSQELLRKEVQYSDAWSVGIKSTQKNVDAYLPGLTFMFALLSVLAIFPMKRNSPAAETPRPSG